MASQLCKSASRAARSILFASKASRFYSEGRVVASAAAVSFSRKVPFFASNYRKGGSGSGSATWISGALALPAAAYMLQDQEVHAAELERTFIAIKPDGVQRGLISEIISRFERKGYKLVGIKVVIPSKEFAQKHYHDLKERPFFNGLCEFLSSGPVIAMVWEGQGVISYGRKLIGATDPQKSEPGTIRGDLAVVVGRNIIHGSDGPETAKDEIKLWFKPEELVSFTSNAEKWIYVRQYQPKTLPLSLLDFSIMVVAKPLTTELVAITEKKMDMTLDDIIKMSKNTKAKKQRRVPNERQKFSNALTQNKSSKVRGYMESRSSLRQGFLAKRRSNFQGNQFPLQTEVARKAIAAPFHYRASNRNRVASWNKTRFHFPGTQRRAASGGFAAKQPRPSPQQKQESVNVMPRRRPKTLDSRFANMREQRMRVLSRQNNAEQHNGAGNRRPAWRRGRFGN